MQAKLLVEEKQQVVKQLPKMSYTDMEGLMRELGGYSGCSHVIVNIGLSDGSWETIESLVCNGKIVASTHELKTYKPPSEVERIIAEVYTFEDSLLSELEELSKIEVPESTIETTMKAYEQPPILKIVEETTMKLRYPTDLLPRVEGDLGDLKDISQAVLAALEAEGIEKYAVLSAIEENVGKVAIVIIGPEYAPKISAIATTLASILRDYGVKEIAVRAGVKTVKKKVE
ncbi:hypothetical protein IPA_04665 [Ignicoccus pacificus DSM 13166]|uniref:Uncharacterized protein n=1 Tax=Ignicoccus pacificus DSM 13166 TaxID=940294 RepID=A0A977PKV7_9CREN|nr:hypothetical protein IPA_04665 [Ignicoccus pacificus DSM 13166]